MPLVRDYGNNWINMFILNREFIKAVKAEISSKLEETETHVMLESLTALSQETFDNYIAESMHLRSNYIKQQHIFVANDYEAYTLFFAFLEERTEISSTFVRKALNHERGHFEAALKAGFPSPFYGTIIYSRRTGPHRFNILPIHFVDHGPIPPYLAKVDNFKLALAQTIEGAAEYELSSQDITMLQILRKN
jgi:hypothetical protein